MEAQGANPLTLLTFSVFHCGSSARTALALWRCSRSDAVRYFGADALPLSNRTFIKLASL